MRLLRRVELSWSSSAAQLAGFAGFSSRCSRPASVGASLTSSVSGPGLWAGSTTGIEIVSVSPRKWRSSTCTECVEPGSGRFVSSHARSIVALSWRSEMRRILTGYLRDGSLTRSQVSQVMHAAEGAFAGREHIVPSASVFETAEKSRLSAYDCEFIVLASIFDIPLVTADKAVLKAFPDGALTMEAFLKQRNP